MAKKSTKRQKVSDQIRKLLESCGQTRYRVAQVTRIDEATLSRFASGERGLSSNALDRLGDFLGLEIVMRGPTEQPQAKKGK